MWDLLKSSLSVYNFYNIQYLLSYVAIGAISTKQIEATVLIYNFSDELKEKVFLYGLSYFFS